MKPLTALLALESPSLYREGTVLLAGGTQLSPGSPLSRGNLVPPSRAVPGQAAAGRQQVERPWEYAPLPEASLPCPWGESEPAGLGRLIGRGVTCILGPQASSSAPGASAG